ncbi:lipopolysaccharide biosynthesis protein [Microbacterium sp.]|uniref:lipopolysaccharide biosynthesis protein n=1 Tax=Microbacterium sp. TaxID=51671 RepID=UPI003563E522
MIRAFSTSLFFNALGSALSGIAIIVVIGILGPAEWGGAAAILGVGQFLGGLLSFGSHTERIRSYSQLPPDERILQGGIESASRIAVAATLIVIATILAFIWIDAAAVVIAAAGTFVSLGVSVRYIADKRYATAGLFISLDKLLALLTVIVLSANGLITYLTLPFLLGATSVIVGLAVLGVQKRLTTLIVRGFAFKRILRTWRGSIHFGISSLAPSLLLFDVPLVLMASDATQAGLFGVATRLTAPLSIAASSIAAVLLPVFAASNSRILPRLSGRAMLLIGGFVGVLAILIATASVWVPLLFGAEFADAAWPVRFYILNVAVILLTRTFATILQAWGSERLVSRLILAQVVVALVGIWLGALAGGAFGASIAVLVSNVVLAAMLFVQLRRSGRRADPEASKIDFESPNSEGTAAT